MSETKIAERVDTALNLINDLCQGRRTWTMSVPARRDYDPDLVLSDTVMALQTELSHAEAQVRELREALDIISNHGVQYPWAECARIARAALAATQPKEKHD